MTITKLSGISIWFSTFLVLAALMGCGSGDFDPGPDSDEQSNDDTNTNTGGSSGLKLEITSEPQVVYLEDFGKTRVIVQFSAKDKNDVPLSENEVDVKLMVDDKTEVESLLDQSSAELEVNIYFAMVLDASYSMTQHIPPAFEPMKTAARDSYQEILDLWSTRPGNVKFSLIWFDEVMNQSQYNVGMNKIWQPNDILTIPAPNAGTATKLYSAVNEMTNYLKAVYDDGVFNAARDQYIMLVFSDGADNLSWFDNSHISSDLVTSSGASYHQYGTTKTELADARNAISNHPKLTTHVIGLGSAVNTDDLKQIATAGGGTYQANPSSENVAQLFERVLKEFTTIQTHGADIPLEPGNYTFTIKVINNNSGDSATYSFEMHAGDAEAGVLP